MKMLYKDDAAWQLVDELERLGYESEDGIFTVGTKLAEYQSRDEKGNAVMRIDADLVRELGFGFLKGQVVAAKDA